MLPSANAEVSTKYVANLLRVAAAQGCDTDKLAEAVGLTCNPLREGAPETLPVAVYNRLYDRITWLLQDECFGILGRNEMPAGTFRMLCYCVVHCRTLRQAIDRAGEFFALCRTLRGEPVRFRSQIAIDPSGEVATFTYPRVDFSRIAPGFSLQHSVAGALSTWHRLCSWLVGAPIPLVGVTLRGQPALNVERFQRIFKCEIQFNAQRNTFSFPARYLNAPIHHSEESLNEFLRSAPYYLVAQVETEEEAAQDLVALVRQWLARDFSHHMATCEELALALGLSTRSLRRKLAERGTSFQILKDERRTEIARQFLVRSELTIHAVAALMGFDEPSAFQRAFKKWTGMTPGQYRRQQAENSLRSS